MTEDVVACAIECTPVLIQFHQSQVVRDVVVLACDATYVHAQRQMPDAVAHHLAPITCPRKEAHARVRAPRVAEDLVVHHTHEVRVRGDFYRRTRLGVQVGRLDRVAAKRGRLLLQVRRGEPYVVELVLPIGIVSTADRSLAS